MSRGDGVGLDVNFPLLAEEEGFEPSTGFKHR